MYPAFVFHGSIVASHSVYCCTCGDSESESWSELRRAMLNSESSTSISVQGSVIQ